MTPEQWDFLTSKLTAIEVLALAIAKTLPDRTALLDQVQAESEKMYATFLDSQLTDEQIAAIQIRVGRFVKALED